MKKKLFFLILMVLTISIQFANAQVNSKNWPKATVEYYKEPRLLIAAQVTPVIGIPFTGIFYGVDVNFKLAKILYLSGGFLAPIIDMSFINGGPKNFDVYAGGELVMWRKKDFSSFDVVTGGGNGVTKYRDYEVKTAELKIFRFGTEYYTNSIYSANFLTAKKLVKDDDMESGIQMPDGNIINPAGLFNCHFFYAGFARRSNQYLAISLSDYKDLTEISKLSISMYLDFFYAPFLKFPDIVYEGVNYKFADYFRVMPFGGRMGVEVFKISGKYVGIYTKIEFGMMPGVGFPAYAKWGIGMSSIYTKMKSIGNELK